MRRPYTGRMVFDCQAKKTHVAYGLWLRHVVVWDGILPIVVLAAPFAIAALLPNRQGLLELTALGLPVAAFFIRYGVGRVHIASNNCSSTFRQVQFCVFFLGIVLLVFIDCAVILSHAMPPGAMFATDADRKIWAILVGIYLAAMFVAMYPGRTVVE